MTARLETFPEGWKSGLSLLSTKAFFSTQKLLFFPARPQFLIKTWTLLWISQQIFLFSSDFLKKRSQKLHFQQKKSYFSTKKDDFQIFNQTVESLG